MKRRNRPGRTAARLLASAALVGFGGVLFWAGPRAGRTGPAGAVVFLGDSITEYCDLAAYYPGLDTVNEGIAGDTTYGMLDRLERVYALSPRAVVVLGGVNDILSGYDENDVAENLLAIVQGIHEHLPRAKVAVQSIYPVMEGEDRYFTGCIQRVNARLEQMAQELDYRYIDVFSALQTEDGRLDSRWSDDGLHPNAAGYETACPVVRRALEAMN